MNNEAHTSPSKQTLGLPSLFAVAFGLVVAQSCFVSILNGAGIGGGSFFIAIFIAFILALCYSATFSELSLMMPKAGSISTYTTASIGHFPAIIATLSGYLIPMIFAMPAELLLVENIINTIFNVNIAYLGLFLVVFFTILNILGIDLFATVQNLLAYAMLVALILIGVVGFATPSIIETPPIFTQFIASDASVFSLVVMAFWAFTGLEFICPMIEEAKNPEKNIPKTMFAAAFILLLVYCLVAYTGMMHLNAEAASKSLVPHWLLVETLFGSSAKIVMAVLAITASSSTINTVVASVPRMLQGMAENNQLPSVFLKTSAKYQTPWFGIIFMSCLVLPMLLFGNADHIVIMLISSGTAWLVAYIIAHINVIVLRIKHPNAHRPFKTPLYPLPQIIGIVGMIYAIINNSPSEEMKSTVFTNALICMSIVAGFAFIWVKFIMKKGLFETTDNFSK